MSRLNSKDLRVAYEAKLKEWGISRKQVNARGWEPLTVDQALKQVGAFVNANIVAASEGCVLIPYIGFDGKPTLYGKHKQFFQLRFLGAEPEFNGKKIRYLQPKESGVHLYLPEATMEEGSVVLTEGPAKGEAGTAAGFKVWAFTGVACWRTPEMEQVVMWGRAQGTGKSRVGHTMSTIYGENYAEISNQELNSTFNGGWAEARQFVMGDEIVVADNNKRAVYDRMKSWITQPKIRINQKFVPVYDVPDRINYYFTSNSPDAFYVADEDRRFFIVEVKGTPLPQEFYDRYTAWLSGDGPAALFYHLLNLDLSGFDPAAKAPETSAKREMIAANRTSAEAWVESLLHAPEEMLTMKGMHKVGAVPLRDLYTIEELTAFARSHASEESKPYITEINVGKALGKFKFQKVRTKADGRIKIPGRGFPYVWIIRNPEKWLNAEPSKIREQFPKELNRG